MISFWLIFQTFTKLRLATHIVVALLLGQVYYNFGDVAEKIVSNIALLFILQVTLYLANSIMAVLIVPTEAAVFLQEHLNNWYSLKSYYSVKVLTDLLMQILCASSFLFISYYMTGQPMEYNRILQAWGICMLITLLAQAVGILVGTAVDIELGIFLVPAMSIPLMLFAGFYVKLEEMPTYLQPICYFSFF
ncbi:PREDICTED: ATP-binding cassette sub-family G member 4-like, partial [Wasmannia auropunctata]|uniref:ATP-binding cassette sub-family G member 4-like n=1 Tax=Wasmannia auropunctata TaxID=64793 RepID=UPI0005F033EC